MTKVETYDIIKAILCKIDCDINHDFQEERHTMSKRVLSLLMALALCFSMLPAAVLAEENAAVQDSASVGDVYAGGEDTELTAGGVPVGESDIAVSAVQALIDALPDEVTADNAEELQAQLIAIDEALAELDDGQLAEVDQTRFETVSAALTEFAAEQENAPVVLAANPEDQPEGAGTAEDPYLIGTLNALKWFRDTVNGGENGICANLTADIALDSEWTPIGTAAIPYIGTFHGGGYRITAKEMTAGTQGWGLFGVIGDGGTVQVLTVSINRLTVTADAAESGVIAAQNAGTIERCAVQINTKFTFRVSFGLVVYQNSGIIENCRSHVTSNSSYDENEINAAGIAYVNSGTIKSCYFDGQLRYRNYALDYAITSSLDIGTVENCYCYDTNLYRNENRYLDGARQGITGVTERNAQYGYTLETGQVTWLLNNGEGANTNKTDPWRLDKQDVGGRPTLNASDGRVTKNSDDTYTLETLHTHRVDGNLCEFAALDGSSLTGSGNYYLKDDVTLSGTWTITGDTALCLNGKTLRAAENANIVVQNGGTLTLLLHDKKTTGSTIAGTGGSCITVSGGTLIMQDGTITNAGGTGVTLEDGSFAMQGGEISGCATGVSVTGGTLTLSGGAKVIDNPAADATEKRNILLADKQKISFGALDASAKFGISAADQENLNGTDRIAVTDENGGQYFAQLVADGFKEDGTGFELYLGEDGKTVALGKQSVHTHCLCNGQIDTNTNQGHTRHTDTTFRPWTETDSLPREGNYYLTRNVTLNGSGQAYHLIDANICLNGYTVTVSNYAYIVTGNYGSDNHKGSLTDCSGKGSLMGGHISITYSGTFNLYGGTLNGTRISITQAGGTLNMYGGKITGNETTVAAVDGQNNNKIYINMYGGEISGNHNQNTEKETGGGGVCVGQGNQFHMYGGTITGNSAKNGGGVYIAAAGTAYGIGTFTMSGGTITGNEAGERGGGVCVDGAFSLSGDAMIRDNTVNESQNNVYLSGGKTINVTGEPRQTIGVTTRIAPADGKPVTIAVGSNYTLKEEDKAHFIPDAGDTYRVNRNDNALELMVPSHEHPVVSGSAGEDVTWQPIDSEGALRGITAVTEGSGYYYLTDSITLQSTTWTPPAGMVLDLNGKSITANGAFDTITVGENVNFTLTDCKGGGENYGSITHGTDPATKPLYSKYDGCGMNVLAGGHFIMYDGSIGGNQNSDAGAGVYVATGAAFDMYGGEIGGNAVPASAKNNGGGIWTAGETTIGGSAKIANNVALAGGGVCVSGGTLTLRDNAEIKNNASINGYNSGIFVGTNGKLCVFGGVQVTENTNGSIGGNVYLDADSNQNITPITVTGALTDSASIGISVPKGVLDSITDDYFVPIATADTEGWIQDDSFIGENDAAHKVIVSDGGKLAQLGTHPHTWEYTLSPDGLSITATCSNERCTADGGSVTIVPPDESTLTYDGDPKAAELTGELKTGVTPEITYEMKGFSESQYAKLPVGSVPTHAAYYKAAVTVGNVTAEAPYTIAQATPTVDDFIITPPTDLVYDGNGKTATVKARDDSIGDYNVMYFEYPKSQYGWTYAGTPTAVGAYVVRIQVNGTGNYAYTHERLVDESNWVFTISPADYTVKVPESWTDSEKPIEVIEGSNFNTAIVAITQNDAVTVTATGVNKEKIVGRVDWYTDEACTQPVERSEMINETAGTTVKLYWKFVFLDDSQKKNYGITKDETGSVDVAIKEGEKQDLSFYDAGGVKTTGSTAKYGGYPIRIRVWNNTLDGGKVACENSEPRVATIDVGDGGYATVTICGVGTTVITATADMVPGKYAKTTATYTLTVGKGEWGESVSVAMQGYVYGSMPNVPSLFNYKGDYNEVTYYYGTTEDINSGEWTEWNLDNPPKLDAGTYYMHAKLKETALYEACTTKPSPFYVFKAFPTWNAPAGLTARYGQKLSDIQLTNPEGNTPGTWSWMNGDESVGAVSATAKIFKAKFTPDDPKNYEIFENIEIEVTVNKADGGSLKTEELTQKYTDTGEKTYTPDWLGLPSGQNWSYNSEYSVSAGSTATLAKQDFAADGSALTYAVMGGKTGDKITITLKASCDNYDDFTITLNITLTDRDDQAALRVTGDAAVVYGQTLTFSTEGGSGTGALSYTVINGTGEATIDQSTGVLTPAKVGTVKVMATKAGDGDHNEIASAPFEVTITPAASTGEPKYTKITTGGKTLNDAALTIDGSTLSPNAGTLEWVDDEGNVLPNDTVVTANRAYQWRFTPDDTNYTVLTGEVTLYRVASSGGGGGGTTRYTVSFETNGGSKISKQTVARNTALKEPTAPIKEGFDFAGWYTDKDLREKYDFSAKVTKSLTLYAAWTEKEQSENQIILTIGEKAAQVFGTTKTNDVAPKIVNDRTMLPARFVAENLGAKVEWNGEKELVTVNGKNLKTGEDITILIYIGSDVAYVNGKEIKLDSAAFVENDRTYTPIRFISEELGASVDWIETEQKVVITK